jgi:hypothetical protein
MFALSKQKSTTKGMDLNIYGKPIPSLWVFVLCDFHLRSLDNARGRHLIFIIPKKKLKKSRSGIRNSYFQIPPYIGLTKKKKSASGPTTLPDNNDDPNLGLGWIL